MILTRLQRHLSQPRNDKRLHFSQHLQHDRHTAIYAEYGYPYVEQEWGHVFPLIQGTGVHETIHAAMADLYPKYVPEHEILLDNNQYGLDHTWVGTADAYVEDEDGQVWLLDYKTISGAGYGFLEGEVKPEHKWQVSAYYQLGPTQECKTAIIYFPTSPNYKRQWAEPIMIEFEPYSKEEVLERMFQVEQAVMDYVSHDELPPIPEGSYQWYDKGRSWSGNYNLIYKPHYTRFFCPWAALPDDPCGCYTTEKRLVVAEYTDGELTIKEGYDTIVEKIGVPDEVVEKSEDEV